MLDFKYSSIIDAPVEVVWKFYQRPDVVKLLIPPWQAIQVIRREGVFGTGTMTEYRLFLGGLSITWIARHTECEEYCFFTEEQISGPFEFWQHRHNFEREDGKTRLTDEIVFSLPGGESVDFISGWLFKSQLEGMFRYRHQVIKRECAVI
ncbi:MAG: cyclase [Rivularia sp. ALOHA_DT_140]|nr:cyclase [Rivularia sp. ALOHA_DT_140]